LKQAATLIKNISLLCFNCAKQAIAVIGRNDKNDLDEM
jgi:hypothetical protein